MSGLSLWHWLIVLAIFFMYGYPIGRVLGRIGYTPWFAILMFLPVANLIGLWAIAFARWPKKPITN